MSVSQIARKSSGKSVVSRYLDGVVEHVRVKNPGEPEFHQAVVEVLTSLEPVLERHPAYRTEKVLDRLVEPERVIVFRVPWVDEQGEIQVNRGYRIEMIERDRPLQGRPPLPPLRLCRIAEVPRVRAGLQERAHDASHGRRKGRLRLRPQGQRSDGEVMRFCQSFMVELQRHIGQFTDVPAGDIGVGGREIGYLFGQYKRIRNEFTGVLTGKGLEWGGSMIRPEATGYGCVYFANDMLAAQDDDLEGKACLVSGSGNVAQYTVEKLLDLGAKPVTLSDSQRVRPRPERHRPGEARVGHGTQERPSWAYQRVRGRVPGRAVHTRRSEDGSQPAVGDPGRLRVPERHAERDQREGRREPAGRRRAAGQRGREHADDARRQSSSFTRRGILLRSGKAANAGGVAVSGLEMSQDALRLTGHAKRWTRG